MLDYISIPEERMKLLKADPRMQKRFQEYSQVKIILNESIEIESDDALKILKAKEVLKAFGRGFDMNTSFDLLDEEYSLEIIDVQEFAGKSKNRLEVLRGRVIGTKGKAKNLIERYADVKVSIYGKTISIIGKWDRASIARKAIEMLLRGRLHGSVYRFLEENRG